MKGNACEKSLLHRQTHVLSTGWDRAEQPALAGAAGGLWDVFFMRAAGIVLEKKNEAMSLDNSWSQDSFHSLCSPKASTMANISSTGGTLANSPELQGLFLV